MEIALIPGVQNDVTVVLVLMEVVSIVENTVGMRAGAVFVTCAHGISIAVWETEVMLLTVVVDGF